MAGAFDDHDVLAVGRAVERAADTVLQLRADLVGVLEVLLREVGTDGDGRHRRDRDVEVEEPVDEERVLVDLVFAGHHHTLGDRLDVAHMEAHRLEGGREAEAGGRLAVVHARRRDEDPSRVQVHRAQEQPGNVVGEALADGHGQAAGPSLSFGKR